MTTELVEELRKMNKLLVLMATKELPQNGKIEMLANAGFGQKEIADFLGTTANTVNTTLNRLKHKKRK